MDKLTIANQVLLKLIETDKTGFDAEGIAAYSFEIAEAMLAEAEKRESKERPDVLKEEWQPDWSQAPEWANWWAMDGLSERANWYIDEPYLDDDSIIEDEWNVVLNPQKDSFVKAPSFNYQGNWQNSLRKRPQ